MATSNPESLKPIAGEGRYVDEDKDTGYWCVFGADSGFAYYSGMDEEQAKRWLENHPGEAPAGTIPPSHELRYVYQEEVRGDWVVAGLETKHSYATFLTEEGADNWLKEHPDPVKKYGSVSSEPVRSELEQFCWDKGITVTLVNLGSEVLRDQGRMYGYTATLHLKGRTLSTKITQGNDRPPSAADVLSCLLTNVSCGDQSFEDYCSEFGANEDSRKEHTLWLTCRRVVPRVKRFLQGLFEEARGKEH
jgi:hypothetical protein